LFDPEGSQLGFIVGHYKSGSTWLANLLSLHPGVRGLRETHLFRYSGESRSLVEATDELFHSVAWAGGGRKALPRQRLASVLRPFRRSGQATLRWEERPTTLLDLSLSQQRRLERLLLQAADSDDYRRRFYSFLFEALHPDAYLLEKTSTNIFYVPEIRRLFPASKLIAIYRDGRDVVVSDRFHLRNNYGRSQDLEKSAIDWKRAMEAQLQYSPRYSLYTLSYEALLENTRFETERLLAFLQLETAPAIVEDMIRRSSFQFVTGRGEGQENEHSFYRKGIVGDWRGRLDDEEKAVVSREVGDMLVTLGFEKSADWRSWT
jgi:Sulfotransferase family